MSISEKIVAAEKALEERRDSLLEVSKQYEENPEPEMLEALEEATSSVDHQVKELETYRRAEKALSTRAAEKSVSAPAIVSNVKSDKKNPVDYLFANAVATLCDQGTRRFLHRQPSARHDVYSGMGAGNHDRGCGWIHGSADSRVGCSPLTSDDVDVRRQQHHQGANASCNSNDGR
jgi:hypothetical protein